MLDDFKINTEVHDLPPEVWSHLKEHRFFAMIIGKEYGGLDFSASANSPHCFADCDTFTISSRHRHGAELRLGRANCSPIMEPWSKKNIGCQPWQKVKKSHALH